MLKPLTILLLGILCAIVPVLPGSVFAQAAAQAGVAGASQGIVAEPDRKSPQRAAAGPVVVLDAVAGKGAMPSPTVNDFVVTDNGLQVPSQNLGILRKDAQGSATQLLLVLDGVNAGIEEFTRSRDAIETFLRQRGTKMAQPVTVLVILTHPPTKAAALETVEIHRQKLYISHMAPSTNGVELADKLKETKLFVPVNPFEPPDDRVRLSLEALGAIAKVEAESPGVKIALWLSPGWPVLARSEAKTEGAYFDSVVYFSDLLRNARMMIYAIHPARIVALTLRSEEFSAYFKGVSDAASARQVDLGLAALAARSGGLVLAQNEELALLLNLCAQDLDRMVTLVFRSTGSTPQTIWHDVQVKRRERSEVLRARSGYYSH